MVSLPSLIQNPVRPNSHSRRLFDLCLDNCNSDTRLRCDLITWREQPQSDDLQLPLAAAA